MSLERSGGRLGRALSAVALACAVAVAGAGFPQLAGASGPTTTLPADASLKAGQSLLSVGGRFHAVMQTDGNLVVYTSANRPVWASGTHSPGAGLTLQRDGNLVVYAANRRALWWTGTVPGAGNRLVMQSDGNLVLYSVGGVALWASRTGRTTSSADALGAGAVLRTRQFLVSRAGRYRVVMQQDGNLVSYGSHGRARWASRTNTAGSTATVQRDGNLVVYDPRHRALWSSGTAGTGSRSRLVVQDDGNLVLYAGSSARWSSRSGRVGVRPSSPSWWAGTCDSGHNRGSHPLGSTAQLRGVLACGGGSARVVRFDANAWGVLEWQCVELAMRYMHQVWGVRPYGADGSQVVANYRASSGGRLVRIANGRGRSPAVGDVVSFGSTSTIGHVAVVIASAVDSRGNGSIRVMEQNAAASGVSTRTVRGWSVSGGATAWLHPG